MNNKYRTSNQGSLFNRVDNVELHDSDSSDDETDQSCMLITGDLRVVMYMYVNGACGSIHIF